MAQYKVDPNKKLDKAIQKTIKELGDLTVPLTLMSREWYKGNRSIFDLGRQGPGKYTDLTDEYSDQKFRDVGFVYPILVRSGKLMRSMTIPDDPNSVNTVINKVSLILGTKVTNKKGKPYPIYLQAGSTKIGLPSRPHVLLGGEQVATSQINQRNKAWIKRLNDWVVQQSEGFAK